MLKFFRKIRQKLAYDNNLSKYSRYAIGEIFLVVIGILIALQINNWNESRKLKEKEQILLNQLLRDFNANLVQLDQKITIRKDFMKYSKALFNLIDYPELRTKDSVDLYLGKTIPYATFDPIINDLAASGELSMIENIALKQALTHWSSNIMDVIEDEVIWKNYRNDHYIPFLVKHYQLRTIRNRAFQTNLLGTYSLKVGENNEAYIQNNIGESKHPEDFNALLDHPDLEDHLSRCYSINSWANVQSDILRKRIVEIIELIESEIVE